MINESQPALYMHIYSRNTPEIKKNKEKREILYWLSIILFLISVLSFRERELDEIGSQNAIDGQVALRLIVLMLSLALIASIGIYGIFKKRTIKITLFQGSTAWLFIWLSWCFITSIYSINIGVSAATALQSLTVFLLIYFLYIKTKNKEQRLLKLLTTAFFLIQVIIIIALIINPQAALFDEWGKESKRLGGFIIHANNLGFVAGTTFLIFIHALLYKCERIKEFVALAALALSSLAILLLSESKTSLIGLIISLLFVSFLRRKNDIKILYILIVLISLFILTISNIEFLSWLQKITNRDFMTFTGRSTAWHEIIQTFDLSNPKFWFGHGYGTTRFYLADIGWAHTHNLFLEVIFGTGIVGFFILIILLTKTFTNAFKNPRKNKILTSSLLLYFFISSQMTGSIGIGFSPHHFLLIILVFLTKKQSNFSNSQVSRGI